MVTEEIRKQLNALIKREVVLATGCTEPGAVALAIAKAREILGCMPDHTKVLLSKNVYKNAMGVGIPGTGMIGLPIVVSMALNFGESSRELEVLTLTPEEIETSKKWLANNADAFSFDVKVPCNDKLYIEAICIKGDKTARVIISGAHTHYTLIELNGECLLEDAITTSAGNPCNQSGKKCQLCARLVYDYATTAPIEELEFIRETVQYNKAASVEGLKGYGLHTGKIINELSGDDIVHRVVSATVAASDARMDGCTLPVYSNSGSGNQGIACTLPVYEYGVAAHCSEEQITRSLILSHLTSIYVKRGIGRLSALCGLVNASIGVTSGLTYLKGGSFEQICYAIKNLINTIAGMVCDGAKPSCALKMSTGIYSAFVSAELAVHNQVVDATDGLAENNIDFSIRNLGRLGHDGMNETDDMILDIMTHKKA